MKKVKLAVKNINERRFAITDLEFSEALKDRELLLQFCVQILQIKPENRNERETNLLAYMAQGIEFFANMQQEARAEDVNVIERCVQVLNHQSLAPQRRIFSAGDIGTRFYIILKGEVGIYIMLPRVQDPNTFELKEVNVLRAGQTFGELALMNETSQRTATIVAKTQCDLATMEKEDYKQILGKIQAQRIARKIYFLNQYPFFADWSFREMKTLSYHFVEIPCYHNQAIYQEGSSSGCLYLVKEGDFEMLIERDTRLAPPPLLKVHPMKRPTRMYE